MSSTLTRRPPSPRTYREFYEHEARTYRITAEAEPAFAHRRALVRKLLPRDAGPRVLDVGCGDGSLSADLHRATKARVVGIDLAHRRVAFASSRTREAAFLQGDVYRIPFPDAAFSLVVCTDLLEHLDEPDRAMAELVRVSSRYVLISVPYSIQTETTLCPHCLREYYLWGHQHSFGKEGIQRMAIAAGARVERFHHRIPMFECRRYRYFPPLKWLLWAHFKDSGTLGALIRKA